MKASVSDERTRSCCLISTCPNETTDDCEEEELSSEHDDWPSKSMLKAIARGIFENLSFGFLRRNNCEHEKASTERGLTERGQPCCAKGVFCVLVNCSTSGTLETSDLQ